MNILCWLGKHDYKVYHRRFKNTEAGVLPVYEQFKYILKPVHKCKRCGKKVYEY